MVMIQHTPGFCRNVEVHGPAGEGEVVLGHGGLSGGGEVAVGGGEHGGEPGVDRVGDAAQGAHDDGPRHHEPHSNQELE